MSDATLQLKPELKRALSLLATSLDKSVGVLINQAVQEYVDRNQLEDKRRLETLVAIESVKSGQVADEETVHAWMESWGTEDELAPPFS